MANDVARTDILEIAPQFCYFYSCFMRVYSVAWDDSEAWCNAHSRGDGVALEKVVALIDRGLH